MLSKIFGYSALAGAALMVGTIPALAHEGHDNMCGGVSEKDSDMVLTSSGKPLLLGSSVACPEEAEVVEVVTRSIGDTGSGAATPDSLPNDGLVYFPLNSDQLDAEDQATLDDIITAVKEQNPASVTVMGFTDRSGDADYNMGLSERRAQTVASALIAAGIPTSAVNTLGYGETEPAVATEDGVVMRQNRRAQLDTQ